MNSYKLLHAMSGIREDYVLEAMDFLGYATEKARPHRVNRKLWTTLLVAASIVSLFTVTAYAMGWFGLRQRMIESAPETQEAVSESASPENSTAPTAEPKRWVRRMAALPGGISGHPHHHQRQFVDGRAGRGDGQHMPLLRCL